MRKKVSKGNEKQIPGTRKIHAKGHILSLTPKSSNVKPFKGERRIRISRPLGVSYWKKETNAESLPSKDNVQRSEIKSLNVTGYGPKTCTSLRENYKRGFLKQKEHDEK